MRTAGHLVKRGMEGQPRGSGSVARFTRRYPAIALTLFSLACIGVILAGFFSIMYAISFYSGYVPTEIARKFVRAAYAGRAAPIQYDPDCAMYDPELSYRLRPGSCKFAQDEFDTTVEVNRAGLRDDEESLNRPEIIVLGDSHAMGFGVDGPVAFPSVLEERLERRTLNAGMSSFGTAREMMLLRQLDRSNARYIVVQYCSNDYGENVASIAGGGKLATMSEAEYVKNVTARTRIEGSFLGPGLKVIRRASDKILGWVGLEENRTPATEAEALHKVLEKNRDLLEGKTLVLLHLNGHNKMGGGVVEGVRERFAGSGLDVLYLRADELLTDEDYLNLDNHMRPSGHRKIGTALAELIEAAEGRR